MDANDVLALGLGVTPPWSPTMRFVAVKTTEQQTQSMLFRTRDLLVRQRTQSINALRGHLAEFGIVAPQGPAQIDRLRQGCP